MQYSNNDPELRYARDALHAGIFWRHVMRLLKLIECNGLEDFDELRGNPTTYWHIDWRDPEEGELVIREVDEEPPTENLHLATSAGGRVFTSWRPVYKLDGNYWINEDDLDDYFM